MFMPDLASKLKFLQAPQSYAQAGQPLECIETHMSWVFLIGQEVFKLKKPVCFPFLDFTRLKAREFYCREEVRLNARMAPGIYLGVVALQWRDGQFALVPEAQLPAPGETVDWLVHMRRLPRQRTLLQLMLTQQLVPNHIDGLLDLLVAFYKSAARPPVSPDNYLSRYQFEQASTREVLLRPQFRVRNAKLGIDGLSTVIAQGAKLLRERAAFHHILEGHGDLRPEHIYLMQPPVVIDCLEFNAPLRQVDPFDEVAYLGLECDMAGAPWVGSQLISGLTKALGDPPPPALMQLYRAQRAMMRARLAMAHLLDPQPRSPDKWTPLAEKYIVLALAAIDAFNAAMLHGSPP
jgi:aminoglycoside phosphotransferase family enzyme